MDIRSFLKKNNDSADINMSLDEFSDEGDEDEVCSSNVNISVDEEVGPIPKRRKASHDRPRGGHSKFLAKYSEKYHAHHITQSTKCIGHFFIQCGLTKRTVSS